MRPELLLALRGIKKNKAFLFIVLSLTLGSANFIISDGLITGIVDVIYDSSVKFWVGDLIVRPEIGNEFIDQVDGKTRKMRNLPGIYEVSQRLEVPATMIHKGNREEISINAFIPSKEAAVINFNTFIVEGKYLSDRDTNSVLIGDILAENLNAKVGDVVEVILPNQERKKYKIKGLTHSGKRSYDSEFLFIHYDKLKEELAIEDSAHKILIKLNKGYDGSAYKNIIMQQGIGDNIKTTEEESQGFQSTINTVANVLRIMIIMTLVIAALMEGIIFYIQVVSKTREIGILKAIGMKKRSIMTIYIFQGFVYGVISVIFGLVLGYFGSIYLEQNPIYIEGANVFLRGGFHLNVAVQASIITLFVAIVASLYPAYKATKIKIVEAMRIG